MAAPTSWQLPWQLTMLLVPRCSMSTLALVCGLAWCLGKDGWPHHCCSTARLLDWASDSSSCEWFGSGMRAYSQSLV